MRDGEGKDEFPCHELKRSTGRKAPVDLFCMLAIFVAPPPVASEEEIRHLLDTYKILVYYIE